MPPLGPDYTATLTIANGQNNTGALELKSQGAHGKWTIGIYTNEGSFTGTVTVEVYPRTISETAVPLQSSGVNVTVNPNSAQVLEPIPFAAFRLSSSAAESEDRTFTIVAFPR